MYSTMSHVLGGHWAAGEHTGPHKARKQEAGIQNLDLTTGV
jgi:hypothetical protein